MVSLDSLLGRQELKERIQELEDEKEDVEERLEKVDRRRANAETEKQEAYEERNRLESKVEELRDRLERAEETAETETDVDVRDVNPGELPPLIDVLDSVEGGREKLTTAHVAADHHLPHDLPDHVREKLVDSVSTRGLAVYVDDHGVVEAALVPLTSVEETKVEHGGAFTVDRSLYRLPESYAVAVITSDRFSAGVYSDGERTDFTSVSSNVKSSHSKGGFSQKRFERLRDEQIQEHIGEASAELSQLLERHTVDSVYLLGASDLTGELEEEADVEAELRQTTDARGEGENLLSDAVDDLRSTRMYRL